MLSRPATGLLLALVTLVVALLGATVEHESAVLPAGASVVELESGHCPAVPTHPQPRCSHRSARPGPTVKAAVGNPTAGPSSTLALADRPAVAAGDLGALRRAAARSRAALQVFRI